MLGSYRSISSARGWHWEWVDVWVPTQVRSITAPIPNKNASRNNRLALITKLFILSECSLIYLLVQ